MAAPVHAIPLPFISADDESAAFLQASRHGKLPHAPLKFMAFSTSLSGSVEPPCDRAAAAIRDISELRQSRQATILESLPIRPTLHRGKQKPGRYFPPLSYSEGERSVLDGRPSRRRRIVRRMPPPPAPPPSSSTLNAARQLISASSYTAAAGWQRAPAGWSWVATRVYLQALPAASLGGGGGCSGDNRDGGSGHGKSVQSAPTQALDHAKQLAVKHAARSAAPPIVVPLPDAETQVVAGATKTLHRRLD